MFEIVNDAGRYYLKGDTRAVPARSLGKGGRGLVFDRDRREWFSTSRQKVEMAIKWLERVLAQKAERAKLPARVAVCSQCHKRVPAFGGMVEPMPVQAGVFCTCQETLIVAAANSILDAQVVGGYGMQFNGRLKKGVEPAVTAAAVCEKIKATRDEVNEVLRRNFRLVHTTRAAGNTYFFSVQEPEYSIGMDICNQCHKRRWKLVETVEQVQAAEEFAAADRQFDGGEFSDAFERELDFCTCVHSPTPPMQVECPHCHAQPGQPCGDTVRMPGVTMVNTSASGESHQARVWRAQELDNGPPNGVEETAAQRAHFVPQEVAYRYPGKEWKRTVVKTQSAFDKLVERVEEGGGELLTRNALGFEQQRSKVEAQFLAAGQRVVRGEELVHVVRSVEAARQRGYVVVLFENGGKLECRGAEQVEVVL